MVEVSDEPSWVGEGPPEMKSIDLREALERARQNREAVKRILWEDSPCGRVAQYVKDLLSWG